MVDGGLDSVMPVLRYAVFFRAGAAAFFAQ
jgi:hypothetical protein